MRGGQGWIRGLNGKMRSGGKSTTCMHWRSWTCTGHYIWCFSVVCCFITGWHIYAINFIHILKGFLDELVLFRVFIKPVKDSQLVGNLSLNHWHYYIGHRHDIKLNLQNKLNLYTLPKFSILALSRSIYSRVILQYHTMCGWWRDITSSILSPWQTYSKRLFHFWIWTSCSTLQFLSTLPLASILCKSRLVSASSGCSYFSPNCWRTQLGRWNFTSQKHISGTFDRHTLLSSMWKLGGR